ncbi:N-acetyltransferase [Brevibacillus reuszeri]|uniref:GNAT family N-acetyltransferase n=1 Tax=Brevibacillus reuszeri TaxID=54915 RepID=UPI001B132A16|nr:GNAT family N-acetyltransferase [Brevibacillus reuszeri]GIO08751.1 N-acetyltransferase [Brevibacillus reuszeri]
MTDILALTQENLFDQHICCSLSDKDNQNGVILKKHWLSCRMEEGLVFKKLDVRGKVFIEYIPAEFAWVPIEAPNYLFINCFWVAGRYKGQGFGARLLNECMEDAKEKQKHGIVAISSARKKPYLSDKSFFLKNGFEVCDTAPPYFELLVKRFETEAPVPKFKANAKTASVNQTNGLVVMYTDQCPFTDYYANQELDEIEKEFRVPVTRIKITSREEAQNAPSAFTIYSAYWNGEFLTHEILNRKKFEALIKKGLGS